MALACNLSRTDRTLRILMGAILGLWAVLIRAHLYGAIFLGLAGLVILVEGAVGH